MTPNSPQKPTSSGSGPTTALERSFTVDAVRGVAVLGILLVNMHWFFGPELYWGLLRDRPWTGSLDRAADLLIRFAAEGKFLAMFSFLFGLGMALQMTRAQARGTGFEALYLRRLAALLAIGLAHGLLLWHGDILTAYAVLGFVLFLLRNQRDEVLVGGAGVAILAPLVLTGAFAALGALARMSPEAAADMEEGMARQREDWAQAAENAFAAYGDGTFMDALAQRAQDFGFMWQHFIFWLPPILGLFLLGLWAGRRGVATEPSIHRPLLRRVALWGIGIGVLANGWYAYGVLHSATGIAQGLKGFSFDVAHGVGAPLLGLGYLAGLALVAERSWGRRILAPFAPVGRMALTNYLAQTVLATAIFYGHGLGLYGQVGPALGLVITVGIFALQLAWSAVWLRGFRFGPVEWAWRCVTYGRVEPLRVASPSSK